MLSVRRFRAAWQSINQNLAWRSSLITYYHQHHTIGKDPGSAKSEIAEYSVSDLGQGIKLMPIDQSVCTNHFSCYCTYIMQYFIHVDKTIAIIRDWNKKHFKKKHFFLEKSILHKHAMSTVCNMLRLLNQSTCLNNCHFRWIGIYWPNHWGEKVPKSLVPGATWLQKDMGEMPMWILASISAVFCLGSSMNKCCWIIVRMMLNKSSWDHPLTEKETKSWFQTDWQWLWHLIKWIHFWS